MIVIIVAHCWSLVPKGAYKAHVINDINLRGKSDQIWSIVSIGHYI